MNQLLNKKGLGDSQRLIDIASARDTSTQEILSYDLIETSTIFKENMPKKPHKASLVQELEKNFSSTDFKFNSIPTLHTSIIVDYKATIKKVALCDLRSIGDIFLAMLKQIESTGTKQDLHLVHDENNGG